MENNLQTQIKALRKSLGVSTYQLRKKGIHASLKGCIEDNNKDYRMSSLIKYLETIEELSGKEITITIKSNL